MTHDADEPDLDPDQQWTPATRNAYRSRGDDLVAALRAHIDLTLGRVGREREMAGYWSSVEALSDAVRAFDHAEFDWCGSGPLALVSEEDEDDEFLFDDPEDDEGEGGDVLSVVGRWDFLVQDPEAFIAGGRAAYLDAWTEEEDEDAAIRVRTVHDAARETIHGDDVTRLEDAPGLRMLASTWTSILHDRDDDAFVEDPFGIIVGHQDG